SRDRLSLADLAVQLGPPPIELLGALFLVDLPERLSSEPRLEERLVRAVDAVALGRRVEVLHDVTSMPASRRFARMISAPSTRRRPLAITDWILPARMSAHVAETDRPRAAAVSCTS